MEMEPKLSKLMMKEVFLLLPKEEGGITIASFQKRKEAMFNFDWPILIFEMTL